MDELKLIPGATSTDSFTLPVDASMVAGLSIDYSQFDDCLFSKTLADCTLAGTTGTVELTQEDTLKLSDDAETSVQIVVLTMGGEVIPSEPIYFTTGRRQNRQVL